ncbi:MAG: methylaspartate ammonia-lyase [Eubacteriales bacterium]
MKIVDVITSPGVAGFYFDDQMAIKCGGATVDGCALCGSPVTAGFSAIRQRGESISIILVLEDGQVCYGDCAAVQYSGAGGRDSLFLAADFIPIIEGEVVPRLKGHFLTDFRSIAQEFDTIKRRNGQRFHTAVRYGVTQALLDAAAKSKKITMAEVISSEYGTELAKEPVPVFVQTGDDRYINADKAIIKRAQVLPHGLINNVETKLGRHGELLLEYVTWLKRRVRELGPEEYKPVLHIDVYGTIGIAFAENPDRMVEYMGRLAEAAAPLRLRIEGPTDAGSKEGQIAALVELVKTKERMGVNIEIVADEWCNTLEDIREFVDAGAGDMVQIKTPDLGGINNTISAVLYAKDKSVGAYLGGTCNETDRSARVCVHVALATRPDQILAKPGMGVDEGYMIVNNEMSRTLAILKHKYG